MISRDLVHLHRKRAPPLHRRVATAQRAAPHGTCNTGKFFSALRPQAVQKPLPACNCHDAEWKLEAAAQAPMEGVVHVDVSLAADRYR